MDYAAKLALFEEAILPHLNAAYNLARWLTRDPQDAEDIVQEAYLRAFRYFDGFKGGDGKAWLLAVVRNTYQTWRREHGRQAVAFDEEFHSPAPVSAPAEGRAGNAQQNVRDCLERLPVEYREVLVMRELEEMSYQEIAQAARLPLGTVMSRLSRARKRLLDCVAVRMKGAAG